MQEQIRGYLRNPDEPVSLDNLDYETAKCLRRTERIGGRYEFGSFDFRDSSIKIAIERPDTPEIFAAKMEREWQEKRKWYIENAPTSTTLFEKGVAEGYINGDDEWQLMISADLCVDDYEKSKQRDLECMCEEFLKRKERERRAKRRYERKLMKQRMIRRENTMIKRFQKMLGVNIMQAAAENPWEVYEELKEEYCASAASADEYDSRIENVVLALGL